MCVHVPLPCEWWLSGTLTRLSVLHDRPCFTGGILSSCTSQSSHIRLARRDQDARSDMAACSHGSCNTVNLAISNRHGACGLGLLLGLTAPSRQTAAL